MRNFLQLSSLHRNVAEEAVRELVPHLHQILDRWKTGVHDMDRTFNPTSLYELETIGRAFFAMIQEVEDAETLHKRITIAAQRLCRMRVPFDSLIMSLHLLEESYFPYLKRGYYPNDNSQLAEAVMVMDSVCHICSAVMAHSYFDEKRSVEKEKRYRLPKAFPTRMREGYQLTPREIEVMKRVVEGYRNREIAEILRITTKTVEHHRASLMRKLGLRHVVDLVRFAIRHRVT